MLVSTSPGRLSDHTADDKRVEAATLVLRETTSEWAHAFETQGRAYIAPRIIFLEPPRHHPSRGSGYFRGVGIVVDLGELTDLDKIFSADAGVLEALMIAHEVAHHVQYLNEKRRSHVQPSGPDRELEADCAAGWWLQRANATEVAKSGKLLFQVPDLDRQLPRLIQALGILKSGHPASSEAEYADSHGLIVDRISAFKTGLSASSPVICGIGVLP